jgi:hypothetical protein
MLEQVSPLLLELGFRRDERGDWWQTLPQNDGVGINIGEGGGRREKGFPLMRLHLPEIVESKP